MKHPIVTITMEDGGIMKVELYPEIAPTTVNNFLDLVKKGFYDGIIFHRVIEGFMGYVIKGEFKQNGVQNDLKHERGVISMARTSIPDSAGSQFFIMHKAAPHLDGGYAAFGKLIEGEDVLDRIACTETDAADKPLKDQRIKSVTAETFGESYPEPEKLPEIEY